MNIKRIIKEKNVNITQLAKSLNITQQRLTAIINSQDLKTSTLRKIATELDCDIADFFADERRGNSYICGCVFVCPECGKRYNISVTREK